MNKNVITAVVGSLCALLLCEPHSLGQTPLSASSLEVTGTATLNILNVNGPAALNALTVSGTTDLLGNSLFFGSWLNNLDQHGVSLLYTDGTSAASPARLTFSATRPLHEWLWEREKADQTGTVPMMKLDASHVLTIYNTAGTAAIVLDPSSPSSPTVVLTQQAADSRYVSSANFTVGSVVSGTAAYPTIALTGGTATGIYSFAGIGATARGESSTASAYRSTASGYNSTASGAYSTASGWESTASGVNSKASGTWSTASGYASTASDGYSTASGGRSTASGFASTASAAYSTAIGYASVAGAPYSIAIGDYSVTGGWASNATGRCSTTLGSLTSASGAYQTVVGVANLTQGHATAWVPTDNLFIVGNGTEFFDGWTSAPAMLDASGNPVPRHHSNALVVKKNGDTTVYGKLTVSATDGSTATTPSGFSIAYDDGTGGVNSAITLQSSRPSTAWNWQRVTASGTAANVMQIDASNRLILTGTAATNPPQLVLDPNGSVTMSGINLLTQTAADALYLSSSVGLSASNGNIGIGTTTPTAMLDVGGNLKVGADASASGAQVQINPKNAGTVGQTIKGFTSQTASLQEWQNSSGNTLASIKIGSGGTPAYDYGKLSLGSDKITGATADMYVSEDTMNPNTIALYITPPVSGRIFFGDSTHHGNYADFTNMRTIIAPPTIYLTTASFATSNNVGTALHPTWSASILRGSQNSSGIMLYPGNYTANILGDMGGEGMSSLPFLVDTRDGHGYQREAGYLFGNMENYSTYSLPHTAWYVNGTESSQLMALQMTGELDVFIHKSSAKGLAIKGATSQTGDLTQWQNASGTALSVVNKNGWMGIGTATPQAALDVNGNANISGNLTVSGTGSLTLPGGIVLSGSNTLSSVITSSTAAYAMASTTAVALSGAIQAAQVNGLSSVATTGAFASLQSHPTTLAGYGITDPILLSTGAYTDPAWLTSLAYAKLTDAPTNISAFTNDAGYITSSGTLSNLAVSGTTNISGQNNISGSTKITGGIVVTGTLDTTTNTVVASGSNQMVLIPQQGDLSMGTFINGTKPQ